MVLGHLQDQLLVQRLDEAHVDDGGIQLLPDLQSRSYHRAKGQQGDALALAPNFRLADGQGGHGFLDGRARTLSARVAHRGRTLMLEAGVEHLPALVLIGRRHDDYVGQAAQIAVIEAAGVGRAIGADQAGAIDGEQHRQLLQDDVVDQLVISALQERGIDRHHRLVALAGQTGRQGHGMLFGDADIEVAAGKPLFEFDQTRAFAHGRRHAQQARVRLGHVAQPLAEHLGVGRRTGLGLGQMVLARVEGADAVVGDRILFRRQIALALLGDHVQEARPIGIAEIAQGGDQGVEIVAVDRADVVEPQFLEQRARRDHALDMLLGPAGQFPDGRHAVLQQFLAALANGRVEAARQQLGQVVVHGADVGRDRHLVVVQHHQQVGVQRAGMVQRLEGHAAGQAAIADDCHRMHVALLEPRGNCHAQGRADGSAGMTDAEGVVAAFLATRKGRQAVLLADARHAFAAAGKYLVRVGLMADIPHQLVLRCVEDVMQCDGQLHRAQTRGQVSAGLADAVQQVIAQFLRQPRQLVFGQGAQVRWIADGVEQGGLGGFSHGKIFPGVAGRVRRGWRLSAESASTGQFA